MAIETFKSLFSYDQDKTGYVGIERECFIANGHGVPTPQAHKVLSSIKQGAEFGYELSACQIETRIGPCRVQELQSRLGDRDEQLRDVLGRYGFSALHTEVGPEDMSLDVYPDPTGRYQELTKNMPHEILSAACRVIGTHVHVGMRDHDMALRVYNRVIQHCGILCDMGDGSSGERLAIYKRMAPDSEPKSYASWDEYYQTALVKGFAQDPRKCWTLIRISVHGTIEFRMFGATDSINRIVEWANYCHHLCLSST